MTCPDDGWDGEALLANLDPDQWEPLPPPRPIHNVIRDLDDYQPTRTTETSR